MGTVIDGRDKAKMYSGSSDQDEYYVAGMEVEVDCNSSHICRGPISMTIVCDCFSAISYPTVTRLSYRSLNTLRRMCM